MKKINIAELLKDCPQGMGLDCTMFENVYLERVEKNVSYPIVIRVGKTDIIRLTKEGCWNKFSNAKCIIFPKGKTTWEGFHRPFVEGDIVSTESGMYIGIVKSTEDSHHCDVFCSINDGGDFFIDNNFLFSRFAIEEEKQKLFDAIKANGYHWNPETKTLEKLPKFKVGDRIKHKGSGLYCTLGEYAEGISAYRTNIGLSIIPTDLEHWELVPDKPYFKVGDRITNGKISITIGYIDDEYYYEVGRNTTNRLSIKNQDVWTLVPNKFDITTLVPFESKVLVRSVDEGLWKPAIYGFSHQNGCYVVGGACWKQCIPYKGNEYLRGTTDACNPFYKTWEE